MHLGLLGIVFFFAMETSRILFSCITPEGKETFTAVLNGEPPPKRKAASDDEEGNDSSIEDSPIPTNYSGPKMAKVDETTTMEQLAACQKIHDEETAVESLTQEDIQLILMALPQFSRECENCSVLFHYHDPTEACLCADCFAKFGTE